MRRNFYSPSDRDGKMTRILTAFFMLMVILLLLDSCCTYKEKTTVTTDTLIVYTFTDSINFETKPEFTFDTTKPELVTYPFTFRIDTIIRTVTPDRIKYDTVKIDYKFPENLLNFSYRPEPDTTKQINKTLTVTRVVELTVWDYLEIILPTALLFLVIGFIIGKLR